MKLTLPHHYCSLALAAMYAALAISSLPAQAADGEQQFAALGSCKLDSGKEITECRLGYRT